MDRQYKDMKQNKRNNIKIRNKNISISNKDKTYKWTLIIIFWTFIFSVILNLTSISILRTINIFIAFTMLILIILFGIIFDIIGIAVTVASEVPFHSMASKRIPEAKYAIKLIKNAEKVSNLCNDVVGDIAGIISGATSAIIVGQMAETYNFIDTALLGILMTALIAALTVGGKSIGKIIAISKSNLIVYKIAGYIHFFKELFIKKRIKA